MENPIFAKNIYIPFGKFSEEKLKALNNTKGIIEWYKNENEKQLIIKYNSKDIQEENILSLI